VGHDVGEVARSLEPGGILIETGGDLTKALQETQSALRASKNLTIFEATFEHMGVLIKADIFAVDSHSRRLVEVKSSASVKDYHLPDVAVQYWVLKGAGFKPDRIELAHINSSFVYRGGRIYRGLFTHEDLTKEARELQGKVLEWVRSFQKVLEGDTPEVEFGDQCNNPFECPFYGHCAPSKEGPEYPVTLLPYGGKIVADLVSEGFEDLRNVPENRLTRPKHQKIWRITISGQPELDPAAAKIVSGYPYPRYYLDFETIAFAVPIWAGTRPYQQVPFQWSCHIEQSDGNLEHEGFLGASGEPPMRKLAESLIKTVGTCGPIFAYGSFEGLMLNGLSRMLPDLGPGLQSIRARLVDLLPLARQFYYHPDMMGSWSIKSVLPTIEPELDYGALEVQDGTMAQQAYLEAIDPSTLPARREAIRQNLLEYCGRDTQALVSIVGFFKNGGEKKFSSNLPATGK
ncbi:MAG: DUF2779 domain-containing protein, partial [Acidobacteriota bacterium]